MPCDDQVRSVLVVDDNEDLRSMVADFLTGEGFEVREAGDGVEALQSIGEDRPDALLLDIMMPRLDGLATLERIRTFDPDLPVVIMTAAVDARLLRHAVFSTATAVLTKPLGLDDVVAALRGQAVPAPADRPREVAPRLRSGRKQILVVDDEPEVRSTIEEILTGCGYDVRGAADGGSALAAVAAQPPDLVLLDVRMPGLNGIDVLASIRALAPQAKVIMITGVTTQNVANQAFAHGVFEYVGKPVDPAYLELCVQTALAEVETLTP